MEGLEDQDSNDECTFAEIEQKIIDLMFPLYANYMVCCADGTYTHLKSVHIDLVSNILDAIHNRFADHVEGAKKEFMLKFKGME
jgi:hypothetical protein